MDNLPKINFLSLRKISFPHKHCAFPDIIRLKSRLIACFRVANDHHASRSSVYVVTMDNYGRELRRDKVALPNTDLRDPRLLIIDERLYLTAYARQTIDSNPQPINYSGEDTRNHSKNDLGNTESIRVSRNSYWVLSEQCEWQHQGFFAKDFHWCWRFTQGDFQKQARHKSINNEVIYSIAYERSREHLVLYSGSHLKTLTAHDYPILSKEREGYGYPNESDMVFAGTTAYAIVRRDADSFTTLFGKSEAPYSVWEWHELEIYLASPCIIESEKRRIYLTARYEHSTKTPLSEEQSNTLNYYGVRDIQYQEGDLKTGLFSLDIETHVLSLLSPLPSFGDNGYPAVVIDKSDTSTSNANEQLLVTVCYYSNDFSLAANNKYESQVYIAKLVITKRDKLTSE